MKKSKVGEKRKQPSSPIFSRSQMIAPFSDEDSEGETISKKWKFIQEPVESSITQASAKKIKVVPEPVSSNDEISDDDQSICIDDLPSPPTSSNSKFKFLASDIARLYERFKQLFMEFMKNE